MWAAQVWLRDFKRDLISAISFKMEVPRFVFKQLVGTFLKRILSMKLWSWIVRHARETILYIFWKLVIIPQTCKFLNKCWLQKSLSHIWAAQVWLNYFTMDRFTPWCNTEASLAPGSCTLQCKQLNKCTQSVQLKIGPSKVCAQVSTKNPVTHSALLGSKNVRRGGALIFKF